MSAATDTLAARLDAAAIAAQPIADTVDLTFDDALAVQRRLLALRAERGDLPVGVKLAFTSRGLMERFGIAEPALGGLTMRMQVADGGRLDRAGVIRPRLECELIVRLRAPLAAGASRAEALAAIDAIAPAIEIIDSRFSERPFRLTEIVADNASAAAFVTGTWQEPTADLDGRAVRLTIDGVVVAEGSTSAILGHPLDALRAAGDLAARRGEVLGAGSLVLLGSATDPFAPPLRCTIAAGIEGYGNVGFAL